MSAKSTFDTAIARSSHFLTLYDLLHNKRKRKVRSDWSEKFKKFMNWNKSISIIRIDGKDSMLIVKTEKGLTYDRFDHAYVSELLRSSVVAAVSALDRFMHDLVLEKCWGLLSGPESGLPKELKNLSIPVIEAKKAIDRVRKDGTARPGYQIKRAIQMVLHESTFQGPNGIETCGRMLGIKDFWGEVVKNMLNAPAKGDIIDELTRIVRRRNQIVHEADLERKIKSKKDTLREITRAEAQKAVEFVTGIVAAIDVASSK